MTPKQEETLRAYLQEAILPLIEEVLVKKLGQAMTFAKEELLKREWVGLTHEEVEEAWHRVEASDFRDCVQPFARAIEAKLKEKNNG